jgi:flavin prenyltransferase
MKILVAVTGASGTWYAQRLLDQLDTAVHEVHLVISGYGQAVIAQELAGAGGLRVPPGVQQHGVKSMNAPFASGSNPVDAMVVIPCSMSCCARPM